MHIFYRQRHQSIQTPLGNDLLNGSQNGVAHHAKSGEQGNRVFAKVNNHTQQGKQDEIEDIKQVIAQDVPVRAAQTRGIGIRIAPRYPLGDFGGR
jgi:hypothetical protein